MSKSLEQHLLKLSEILEDNPDPWFNAPKGWLKKPDFKRPAQEKVNIDRSSRGSIILSKVLGSGYQMRWFVLNVEKKLLTYYKDDNPSTPESGHIDMKVIRDIQLSKVFDAPEFALDLISDERHYTVVAESHASMVRWAFAFNHVKKLFQIQSASKAGVASKPSKNGAAISDVNLVKWFRYDVIYEEPGPLMINVMGMANKDKNGNILNNWIIVTSFENKPDGSPGRSEQSGMISVKDYIVGVNGVDLTTYTFNDAMDTIVAAAWPKTIHFLRDNFANREANRVESWAFVYYPSLNRRRRRYIELRRDAINFRKPAPGGSANSTRDAYISVERIAQIRPVIDKTMPSDQQFILQLVCKPSSFIDHVDENDLSIGGSPVEVLELCFAKQQHMNSWRSALVSPTADSPNTGQIPVLPVETIEGANVAVPSTSSILGIKSYLTGRFTTREFTLVDGSLRWRRPKDKNAKIAIVPKERSIFIANSAQCGLKSIRAVQDPVEQMTGFQYQIVIQASGQSITLGMADEKMMMHWLAALREVVLVSPGCDTVTVPTSVEVVHGGVGDGREDDDDNDLANMTEVALSGMSLDKSLVQGYLFKKGERMAPGIGSEDFRKRWFVLQDFTLWYYKNPSESRSMSLAMGSMDLRAVLEVREGTDPSLPENAIEVITPSRIFLLVAEDEDEQLRWLDALGDTLEMRSVAVQREVSKQSMENNSATEAARLEAKRQAVLFAGTLSMRSVNRLTSIVTWKDRYFVIANGAITYYDRPESYLDEDKDSIGEISLLAITLIDSSTDPKCPLGCAFDIHAHVLRGGDSSGRRVFTLNARSTNLCKEWMQTICDAIGTVELRPKPGGGFISVVSENAVKRREEARRRSSMAYANSATIQKVQVHDPSTSSAPPAPTPQVEDHSEGLTEEEIMQRKMARGSIAARRTSLALDRGGRGRGLGVAGPAVAPIRRASVAASTPTKEPIDETSAIAASPPPPPIPSEASYNTPTSQTGNHLPLPPTRAFPRIEEDTTEAPPPLDESSPVPTVTDSGVVSPGGAGAAAAIGVRKPLLAGGRGGGRGRGAAFQAASAQRKTSTIASGEI